MCKPKNSPSIFGPLHIFPLFLCPHLVVGRQHQRGRLQRQGRRHRRHFPRRGPRGLEAVQLGIGAEPGHQVLLQGTHTGPSGRHRCTWGNWNLELYEPFNDFNVSSWFCPQYFKNLQSYILIYHVLQCSAWFLKGLPLVVCFGERGFHTMSREPNLRNHSKNPLTHGLYWVSIAKRYHPWESDLKTQRIARLYSAKPHLHQMCNAWARNSIVPWLTSAKWNTDLWENRVNLGQPFPTVVIVKYTTTRSGYKCTSFYFQLIPSMLWDKLTPNTNADSLSSHHKKCDTSAIYSSIGPPKWKIVENPIKSMKITETYVKAYENHRSIQFLAMFSLKTQVLGSEPVHRPHWPSASVSSDAHCLVRWAVATTGGAHSSRSRPELSWWCVVSSLNFWDSSKSKMVKIVLAFALCLSRT